jgi:hypothetical protein
MKTLQDLRLGEAGPFGAAHSNLAERVLRYQCRSSSTRDEGATPAPLLNALNGYNTLLTALERQYLDISLTIAASIRPTRQILIDNGATVLARRELERPRSHASGIPMISSGRLQCPRL